MRGQLLFEGSLEAIGAHFATLAGGLRAVVKPTRRPKSRVVTGSGSGGSGGGGGSKASIGKKGKTSQRSAARELAGPERFEVVFGKAPLGVRLSPEFVTDEGTARPGTAGVVSDVTPGGQGANSGLRVGDRVIAVAGEVCGITSFNYVNFIFVLLCHHALLP